ncbi:MAG: ABC transporter ATP-binding protein [Synechococcales cyanobacterium T60_A2020_003]|nr:ABC transporter ATP-binding protein [Synechococcales cyanobacterium T60_A2020_003]
MNDVLLQVDQLRVAYPYSFRQTTQTEADEAGDRTQWAVDDVSFTLKPGERLGLVGESGCGKSTLGRAIMRLLPAQSQIQGQVSFEGRSVLDLSPRDLRIFRGESIALVFQDPMTRLDPLMTIGDHCLETLQAHRPDLSTADAKALALETLAAVNIPAERWGQYPHEFSGGMRQRVAIALALLLNPKLIVADEPTTSLDVTVATQILNELTRLCQERQMALILISHDLAMVAEYCDRIAVMYGGKMVETGMVRDVLTHPQHPYTRSLLQSALHIQTDSTDTNLTPQATVTIAESNEPIPLLRIRDLKQYFTLEESFLARLFSKPGQSGNGKSDRTIRAVDGVSLDLYPGEILGLVGESGCGKSTLSRTILQIMRPTSGTIEFLGRDITHLPRAALQQQRRQMQMVFQDPRACLNPLMTVGQSIADPLLIHRLADRVRAKTAVVAMLERVGLTPAAEFYNRYPGDLSGGQQQRVAIARALITHPKLLICDEPVSMLDASVQSQVLELMLELKDEFDLTYLFITHDLWVARYLCDRIAVMNAGKIVEIGDTASIFSHPQHPYTQVLLSAIPLLQTL